MISRFLLLSHQILVLGCVSAVGSIAYVISNWWTARKYEDRGVPGRYFAVYFFTAVITVPATEELICRLPLPIAFSGISAGAWAGIVLTGIVFGLVHYPKGFRKDREDAVSIGGNAKLTDWFSKPIMGNKWLPPKSFVLRAFLGVMCGYCAIRLQSLYAAFAVHALWNSVMWVPLAALICSYMLRIKVKEYFRHRRSRNFELQH